MTLRNIALVQLLITGLILVGWIEAGIAQTPEQAPQQPVAQPRQVPEIQEPQAEDVQGIPVLVEHLGADPVGMRLALHLKETFQKSGLFHLGEPQDQHLSLRLVTRPQFT